MKKGIKVLIILLIFIGIVGMWLLKNYDSLFKTDILEVNEVLLENEKETLQNNIEINEEVKIEEVEIKEESTEEVIEGEDKKDIKQDTEEVVDEEKVQDIDAYPNQNAEEVEVEQPIVEIERKPEINLDDPNFELVANLLDLEALKQYNLPILIDFGAEGCIPCQMMYPTLEELNEELRGKAIVKFIDVWEYPEAANGFEFSLIPTQYFFDKEGNQYMEHTGILNKDNILTILKEMGMEE